MRCREKEGRRKQEFDGTAHSSPFNVGPRQWNLGYLILKHPLNIEAVMCPSIPSSLDPNTW